MKKIKLFYKKDYEFMVLENTRLNGKVRDLESELSKLKSIKDDLTDKVNKLTFDFERSLELVEELDSKLSEKTKELKALNGAKGGLVKRVNELTDELNQTKLKLKESMTDKYLVKKIKSGRTPNTIRTATIRPVKGSVQGFQKGLEMEVNDGN